MNHQVSSPMSMAMDRPSGRVLVTGALGQIGTELVEALQQKHGHEAVIATDIRKADGCRILDVMDKKEIHKLVIEEEITEIYHFSSITICHWRKKPRIMLGN